MSNLQGQFVIGDNVDIDFGQHYIDGTRMGRGLVPRDYSAHPQGCYAAAPAWSIDDMPIIPMEEWPERIQALEATKMRISDFIDRGNLGQPIPSYDQNGQGFCWTYSPTGCVTAMRAIQNMPYIRLSAHSVACKIFNFQDRGAWSCLALDYIREHGIVPESLWPAKSMNRQLDTPDNWKAALDFRAAEGWMDLKPAAYDRDLSRLQVGTALLNRWPICADYMHMGHAMCTVDLVDVYPNKRATDFSRYGTKHWNSWTDRYGVRGFGIFKDSKAWPDGGAAIRSVVGG